MRYSGTDSPILSLYKKFINVASFIGYRNFNLKVTCVLLYSIQCTQEMSFTFIMNFCIHDMYTFFAEKIV